MIPILAVVMALMGMLILMVVLKYRQHKSNHASCASGCNESWCEFCKPQRVTVFDYINHSLKEAKLDTQFYVDAWEKNHWKNDTYGRIMKNAEIACMITSTGVLFHTTERDVVVEIADSEFSNKLKHLLVHHHGKEQVFSYVD